ncbi:hypothetical protein SCOCK_160044 [Actinacidiphila cocklensis]|uniref:Uncharacterized protein n=1 Tax=Actinacidiphila cocklensis TaxID=887465 RepID=A0A9W4GPH5_9ACTN|nr:hypothetical protein SCOCK_160044 [Actinacidiphila cocklensis]
MSATRAHGRWTAPAGSTCTCSRPRRGRTSCWCPTRSRRCRTCPIRSNRPPGSCPPVRRCWWEPTASPIRSATATARSARCSPASSRTRCRRCGSPTCWTSPGRPSTTTGPCWRSGPRHPGGSGERPPDPGGRTRPARPGSAVGPGRPGHGPRGHQPADQRDGGPRLGRGLQGVQPCRPAVAAGRRAHREGRPGRRAERGGRRVAVRADRVARGRGPTPGTGLRFPHAGGAGPLPVRVPDPQRDGRHPAARHHGVPPQRRRVRGRHRPDHQQPGPARPAGRPGPDAEPAAPPGHHRRGSFPEEPAVQHRSAARVLPHRRRRHAAAGHHRPAAGRDARLADPRRGGAGDRGQRRLQAGAARDPPRRPRPDRHRPGRAGRRQPGAGRPGPLQPRPRPEEAPDPGPVGGEPRGRRRDGVDRPGVRPGRTGHQDGDGAGPAHPPYAGQPRHRGARPRRPAAQGQERGRDRRGCRRRARRGHRPRRRALRPFGFRAGRRGGAGLPHRDRDRVRRPVVHRPRRRRHGPRRPRHHGDRPGGRSRLAGRPGGRPGGRYGHAVGLPDPRRHRRRRDRVVLLRQRDRRPRRPGRDRLHRRGVRGRGHPDRHHRPGQLRPRHRQRRERLLRAQQPRAVPELPEPRRHRLPRAAGRLRLRRPLRRHLGQDGLPDGELQGPGRLPGHGRPREVQLLAALQRVEDVHRRGRLGPGRAAVPVHELPRRHRIRHAARMPPEDRQRNPADLHQHRLLRLVERRGHRTHQPLPRQFLLRERRLGDLAARRLPVARLHRVLAAEVAGRPARQPSLLRAAPASVMIS